MNDELTHRVAAAAYLFRDRKMLLLRRCEPPCTFVPPGGKLELNEDPLDGLRREVREETGLEIEVIGLAHTWFGRITTGDQLLLAINYLATTDHGEVRLSDEHTDYVWVTREQLANGEIDTRDCVGDGYHRDDLLDAFDLFEQAGET